MRTDAERVLHVVISWAIDHPDRDFPNWLFNAAVRASGVSSAEEAYELAWGHEPFSAHPGGSGE